MAVRRAEPYIWVTWLTKLLAGESTCEWSAWFRAHHKEYDKLPVSFDLARWTVDHNELVNARREQLLDDGFRVFVEDENAFKRRGKTGIVVSGKPDILALRDGRGVIEDCKTGRPRTSDQLQVLVYLLLLPIQNERTSGIALDGRVVYKTGSVDVPGSGLDDAFRDKFVAGRPIRLSAHHLVMALLGIVTFLFLLPQVASFMANAASFPRWATLVTWFNLSWLQIVWGLCMFLVLGHLIEVALKHGMELRRMKSADREEP